MQAGDFRDRARAALKGKWIQTTMVMLLATLLGASVQGASNLMSMAQELLDIHFVVPMRILNLMTVLSLLLGLFAGAVVQVGLAELGGRLLDGETPTAGMLFPRGVYWRAVGMGFLKEVILLLAAVPALIAVYFGASLLLTLPLMLLSAPLSYGFAMAEYLLCHHRELGAWEALRLSWVSMKGNKLGLFLMCLSFIGWELLSLAPMCVLSLIGYSRTLTLVGVALSLIANAFVRTYMHISCIAFYRYVERGGDEAQEERTVYEDGLPAVFTDLSADEAAARELFMSHRCSLKALEAAGRLDEYRGLNPASMREAYWKMEYSRQLMLRFDRDAQVLDDLLALAGEYAMDDLLVRILYRIERHARQQTLPDEQILDMCRRAGEVLQSDAFAHKPGLVERGGDQIAAIVSRIS